MDNFPKKILFGFFCLTGIFGQVMFAQSENFRTEKLAEDIFAVIRTNPLEQPIDSNSLIIINENDVIVVDSNVSLSSTRKTLEAIAKLTTKPVRYVINTHWHDDHVFGNQVYREKFPQVEFIVHSSTLKDLKNKTQANLESYQKQYPLVLGQFEKQLTDGKNAEGKSLTENEKQTLKNRIEFYQPIVADVLQIKLIPPDLTIENSLTLYRGNREIRILHIAGGHTDGDLAVYLPNEKILATGDLIVAPVPFSLSPNVANLITSLKILREIDAEKIVPGHGDLQTDRKYLETMIELLESVQIQTKAAFEKGLSVEQTIKSLELKNFDKMFVTEDKLRSSIFKNMFVKPAVEQIFQELKRK